MPRTVESFQIDLLRRLLTRGRRRARRYLLGGGRGGAHKSRQLAREMTWRITGPETGHLFVNPYWAVYFHDGRGPISKRRGRLVWFKDRREDPRLRGGRTPDRAKDLRRLTAEQFREARLADKIYVRRSVGPVSPTPFFSNTGGMAEFRDDARKIIRDEFDRYVDEILSEFKDGEEPVSLEIRA